LAGVAVLTFALIFTACNKTARTQSSSGGGAAPTSGAAAKSGAAGWEKARNDYEAFVDKYVAFMKEFTANPGDPAMLGKYASMAEQAEKASDSISKLEDEVSGDDLEKFKFTQRYIKIAEKMTAALQ
jgi:hypothetical protein